MELRGTTILAVRRNGKTAIAGDGQVTMNNANIMKATAKKVRRLYHDRVVVGFAGSVADAFSLCERFEQKLEQYSGSLPRASVALAHNHPFGSPELSLDDIKLTSQIRLAFAEIGITLDAHYVVAGQSVSYIRPDGQE